MFGLLSLLFVAPALVPGRVLSSSDSFWFQSPWNASVPAGLERPANPDADDAPGQFHQFIQFTKRELPDVPLWNPHLMSGRPLVANAQSALLSPFTLPSYVLPFYASLALVAALKLFAASFGGWLLGRALGMSFAGASIAGLAYGFSLWLVTWLPFPHASAWALMPLLLWLTDRLSARPSLGRTAAFAAGGAAVLAAGHPESAFHVYLAGAAFLALRLVQRRATGVRRPLLAFCAGVGWAAALAAAVLLPLAELIALSADIHQRAGSAAAQSLPPRYLLELALYDYWGRGTGTAIDRFLLARALYGGALTLMLAAAALIVRPTRERLALAGFGALCLAVVFAIPPLFQIVTALPVFGSGHNTRLSVLFMLCLALLAGFGADELCGRVDRRRARLVLAVAAALLLAPAAWVIGGGKAGLELLGGALEVAWGLAAPPALRHPDAGDTIRLASLLVWIPLAGAALALLAGRLSGRLAGGAFAALAVALLALDLFRAGMGYNPAIDADHATQPATGAIRYLRERRPRRFVTTAQRVPAPWNVVAMRFGLHEARGYDLPVERRYDALWRREVSPEFPEQDAQEIGSIPLSVPSVDARRLRTLSLLGVADVMQPAGDPPLEAPGLELAYEGEDARVYANRRALPRTWVVAGQTPVAGADAALRAVMEPGFEPLRSAVVEEPLRGLPRAEADPAGRARIVEYEPDRLLLESTSSRAGLLVLSDSWYPGWKARVEGRDERVERVDYVLRGVRVPAGRATVELRYEPLSWRLGWLLSLSALAALPAAALRARLRSGRRA